MTRYASSAAPVTAKLPDIADGMSESCRRTASYRLRRSSSDWYADDSLRLACASRDTAMRDVIRVNRVLAAYLAALQSLAADKVTDPGARVDALGAALRNARGFDGAQARAVEGLARFAYSRSTDGYRRAKLRDAISSQNENVQTVTSALHDILARDVIQLLENDIASQTSFYRGALTESTARDPLTAILVRDAYDARAQTLAEQSAAVRALSQAMLTVGRGHQALYDSRDHLGGRALLALVVSNARELDDAMARVNKAF